MHSNERTRTTTPPKKNPNETEVSNLPDKQFKVMVIRMFIRFGRRIKEHSENCNKDFFF